MASVACVWAGKPVKCKRCGRPYKGITFIKCLDQEGKLKIESREIAFSKYVADGKLELIDKSSHTLVIDRTGDKPLVFRVPKGKPIKPPNIIRKARNFSKAAVAHVKAGRPKATEAQVARRFEICMDCEHLQKERMRCRKCGCGVKQIVGRFSKLSWADSRCPVGKWLSVDPKDLVEDGTAN